MKISQWLQQNSVVLSYSGQIHWTTYSYKLQINTNNLNILQCFGIAKYRFTIKLMYNFN